MSTAYFRLREIEEREAADNAASDTARYAHHRMATLYAAEAAARDEAPPEDRKRFD